MDNNELHIFHQSHIRTLNQTKDNTGYFSLPCFSFSMCFDSSKHCLHHDAIHFQLFLLLFKSRPKAASHYYKVSQVFINFWYEKCKYDPFWYFEFRNRTTVYTSLCYSQISSANHTHSLLFSRLFKGYRFQTLIQKLESHQRDPWPCNKDSKLYSNSFCNKFELFQETFDFECPGRSQGVYLSRSFRQWHSPFHLNKGSHLLHCSKGKDQLHQKQSFLSTLELQVCFRVKF